MTNSKYDIARRWAPVHYQDVDTSNYRADYVCAVNFDGNWETIGNWDALDDHPLIPTVYYSVEETHSHWYIIYMFYRPRDWTDAPWALFFDQHENDSEGFLTVIRKPRNWWERVFFPHGVFEAMVTVSHHDFYSFSNTLQGNRETVDGPVRYTRLNGVPHISSFQEAKTHACYAWNGREFPGGDGIRYYPADTAEAPGPPYYGPIGAMDAPYMLVDIFEPGGLWERRCNLDHPFASDGAFAGKKFKVNAANPPWRWNDGDDGDDIHTGAMAFDPAYMISRYFTGDFSRAYIDPRYIPFMCNDEALVGKGDDPQARYMEALQLAVTDNIASIDILMEAVFDRRVTWETRATLAHQSGRSKAFKVALTGAIKSLFDAVLDPPNARGIGKKLMESFSTLGDAVSIFYLCGLLRAPVLQPYLMEAYKFGKEYPIQYSSGEALTHYQPQNPAGYYPIVRRVMNSYNVGVRGVSTQLYGRWYAKNDVAPLAQLMYDDQAAIRWQAVDATKGVRTGQARAVLANRAEGDDLYASTRAAQILVDDYGAEGLQAVRQSHPEAYKFASYLVDHPEYDLGRDFSATPTDAESDQRLQLVMSITDALAKLRPEINPRRDIDIET